MKTALHALLPVLLLASAASAMMADQQRPRRRATPVNTAATTTQSVNETRDDTSRINAARRASSTHYHRQDGATVWVDTVTGDEWIDSSTIRQIPRMQYPLLTAVTVGVDIWDPVMRLFGQKHGLIGFNADVSLHNRYFPAFEIGLGQASNTPAGENYSYHSPLSVFFKLGINYNFLYNSSSDYQFFAMARYGFSPFSWNVDNITLGSDYWDQNASFSIPSQHSTAGWFEFGLGLRIKLGANIYAGWMVKYHSLLHESSSVHGEPWYIPGYGTRGQSITGSFSISYTLPLGRRRTPEELMLPPMGADSTVLITDSIVVPPADTVAVTL